jgi:ribulose-5-phosphate 4-epimerase/fuculose-1-phosphate aldolase
MHDAQQDVWRHARRMFDAGLVTGSAGNVSRRADSSLIAITPTSVPYDELEPEHIALVDLESGRTVSSGSPPSYELPMHLVIYQHKPDVAAIVHTHAPFVTTLSILRRPLPPLIDEMVVHLGGTIEVAEYAFTGTSRLGHHVLAALGDRAGAILANHGNVCVGKNLERALHAAIVMEAAAQAYVQALSIGEPIVLPDSAIVNGRRMFDERR